MKNKIKKEVVELMKIIIISIFLTTIITQFVRPTIVKGESMYPTLKENDYLLIDKVTYKIDKPERKDIVVFRTNLLQENGEAKDLVKRVIAIEGDHIQIKNSNVYLNGNLLEEEYINDNYTDGNVDLIVPKDKIFIMGDNREKSLDSRYYDVGLIDYEEIIGKVSVRLFPMNNINKIE